MFKRKLWFPSYYMDTKIINISNLDNEINKILREIQNSNTKCLQSFFNKHNIHWTELYYHKTGDTILHCAARLNLTGTINYLLNNFQPNAVDCKNKDDKTALHEAAQFGQYEACKLLVEYGANVNALKRADWTPLMLACTKMTENHGSRLKIVDLLLNKGSLVNYKNKDGWTCVHLISREGDIDIFNLLVKNGADYGVKTRNGRTGLHIAALHGNLDIVKYYLNHTFDINIKDNCGNTSLHEAILGNHIDICRTLIDHGADITMRNKSDYGLVHLAASEGHIDMIKFILNELNCDINDANKDNLTALHCAARTKQRPVYNFLVENGANENVEDKFGRIALDYIC